MCDYRSLGVGLLLPPRWGPLLFLLSSIYEAGWTSSFAGPWPPTVHVAVSISLCGFWKSTSDDQACSPSICPSGAISMAPYFDIIFCLKNSHHEDAIKTTLCWLLRGWWMVDEAWLMPFMATVIILVVLTWWVCSVSFFPQKCHSMQIYPHLSSMETEFHHVSCPACRFQSLKWFSVCLVLQSPCFIEKLAYRLNKDCVYLRERQLAIS